MPKTTIDLQERAVHALRRTWQSIGYDVLHAYGGEQVELTAAEVREAVTACGFVGGHPEQYGDDREAVRWLDRQPRTRQERIVRSAFPRGRYGA